MLIKLQYKYGPEWEVLYQGPLAIVQKNNAMATRTITDALTSFPSEARLYGYGSHHEIDE